MAKTRERKLEVAKRIHELVCDEHGMDPELLIFDDLTFTLTTGDEEWRPSAVETIEGIRLIKAELPGVKTSLGVSNVSFGIGLPARSVLNSVFLHHCVEAGLDLAMVNPNHITPYGEIGEEERELADDLVFNRREDALERFIDHFESKGPQEAAAEAAEPHRRAWSPRRRCTSTSCAASARASRTQIDKSVEKIGAVPTLNDVLLPAMKEVGDKFGAGELILPFVLQSAEVMKRAVAQLEQYLDKLEGYTKGTVVLATVFGDVHDIGKSLVNTILTNNGYKRRRPRQAGPDRHDPRRRARSTTRPRSACPRCSSRPPSRCRSRIQELHQQGLEYPLLIGGAAINRKFGLRAPVPGRQGVRGHLRARRLLLQGRLRGPRRDGPDRRARARAPSSSRRSARRPRSYRDEGEEPEVLDTTDDSVRSAAATDNPVPEPPFWGVREIDVDLDEVYSHLDTHVLFKLHWGGRGVKGDAWRKLLEEDFRPRLERMWAEQPTTCTRARCSATSPATPRATRSSCSTRRTARPSSSASTARASPRATASRWPTSSARRTAASSTSSRCRPSPRATRSPS